MSLFQGNITTIYNELHNIQLLINDLSQKQVWSADDLKNIPHHFLATPQRLMGMELSKVLHIKYDESGNIIAVSLCRFD